MQKVLIDCDPGTDDLCAIVLAAHLADVVGIVSVSGNVPLEHTTRNALFAAELTGLECPVVEGAAMPLSGEPRFARGVHGETGLGDVALPQVRRTLLGEDATEFLLRMSREYKDLWIVAIGPLTNIALAVQADDGFAHRLGGISVMGGSVGGGNTTAAAEFNFWADPEAADVVLSSGARMRLCGLNLTQQVLLDEAFIERVAGLDSPEINLVREVLSFMVQVAEKRTGRRLSPLHDPCAVAAVTHPQLFEFTERPVQIELDGTLTRGMSVVDERTSLDVAPANVEVAYGVDREALFQLMFDAVADLE
ncbi:MAG: nucleoside hydrolase [Acidimicrobiales bacterium]